MRHRPAAISPFFDWHAALAGARRRLRASWWPAVQASIAAALAWLTAHRLLGHPQPFFAPIAAAIAMSTSYFRRSRRTVQMVVGVLLGIGTAELLGVVLGASTLSLGVIVLTTMLIAIVVGGGFVGEGMMFVNQAAASAILVVALRRHGTGAERAVDALLGGGVAFVVGVVVFPAAPLPRLRQAERATLESLANSLEHVARLLDYAQSPEPGWTLAAGYDIHEHLAALAQARAMARTNVLVAPRRWRLRTIVAAEDKRLARLDLLANAVLSLVRATTTALEGEEPLPAPLTEQIAALASALRGLASSPQPWPPQLVRDVEQVAERAIALAPPAHTDRVPIVTSILRAAATDLAAVIKPEDPPV